MDIYFRKTLVTYLSSFCANSVTYVEAAVKKFIENSKERKIEVLELDRKRYKKECKMQKCRQTLVESKQKCNGLTRNC